MEVEVLFVFVLLPVGCGFWVKMVRIEETIVVGWRSCPVLTKEDTIVEVTSIGDELCPPPDVEEIEFPFPDGPLD